MTTSVLSAAQNGFDASYFSRLAELVLKKIHKAIRPGGGVLHHVALETANKEIYRVLKPFCWNTVIVAMK